MESIIFHVADEARDAAEDGSALAPGVREVPTAASFASEHDGYGKGAVECHHYPAVPANAQRLARERLYGTLEGQGVAIVDLDNTSDGEREQGPQEAETRRSETEAAESWASLIQKEREWTDSL
jgi:hypothetical protein